MGHDLRAAVQNHRFIGGAGAFRFDGSRLRAFRFDRRQLCGVRLDRRQLYGVRLDRRQLHGSRFDIKTGRLRRGPSVYDQPAYEVRPVEAGGYEARRIS